MEPTICHRLRRPIFSKVQMKRLSGFEVHMQKLTHNNFIKAHDFIMANGTDIDRAWFKYNFEDSNEEDFLRVLCAHQYENGGFCGLYHEFAYRGPCLKCTEIAIEYIFGLKNKPSSDLPIIKNIVKQ